jgi:hypothetical protein
VRNLNPRCGALLLQKPRDSRQRLDVLIFPDAHICRRNATDCLNGGGFYHHRGRAAYRSAAQMDQMPVVGKTVNARVLAHGRHQNSIAQIDAANL